MTVFTDIPKSFAILDNDFVDFLDLLKTSSERSRNNFCLDVRLFHDFLKTGILFLFTKSYSPSQFLYKDRHKFV